MCLAVPLQVIRMEGVYALCAGPSGEERIDTLLTGPLAPGQWVLGFLGAAREVIDAERAAQVTDALATLGTLTQLQKLGAGGAAANDSECIDAVLRAGFADLIEREPQLPDFLRKDMNSTGRTA
jgi:hydrogenase expression/formation protein HypC